MDQKTGYIENGAGGTTYKKSSPHSSSSGDGGDEENKKLSLQFGVDEGNNAGVIVTEIKKLQSSNSYGFHSIDDDDDDDSDSDSNNDESDIDSDDDDEIIDGEEDSSTTTSSDEEDETSNVVLVDDELLRSPPPLPSVSPSPKVSLLRRLSSSGGSMNINIDSSNHSKGSRNAELRRSGSSPALNTMSIPSMSLLRRLSSSGSKSNIHADSSNHSTSNQQNEDHLYNNSNNRPSTPTHLQHGTGSPPITPPSSSRGLRRRSHTVDIPTPSSPNNNKSPAVKHRRAKTAIDDLKIPPNTPLSQKERVVLAAHHTNKLLHASLTKDDSNGINSEAVTPPTHVRKASGSVYVSKYDTIHDHVDLSTGKEVVTKKVKATIRRQSMVDPMKKQTRFFKTTTKPITKTVRQTTKIAKKSLLELQEFSAPDKVSDSKDKSMNIDNNNSITASATSNNAAAGAVATIKSETDITSQQQIPLAEEQQKQQESKEEQEERRQQFNKIKSEYVLSSYKDQQSASSLPDSLDASSFQKQADQGKEEDQRKTKFVKAKSEYILSSFKNQEPSSSSSLRESASSLPAVAEEDRKDRPGQRRVNFATTAQKSMMNLLIRPESQEDDVPKRVRGRMSIQPSQYNLSPNDNNNHSVGVIDAFGDQNSEPLKSQKNMRKGLMAGDTTTKKLADITTSADFLQGEDESERPPPQYTLKISKSHNFAGHKSLCNKILEMMGMSSAESDWEVGTNYLNSTFFNPSVLITRYLHWCFRVSFVTYLASATLIFFGLTSLFALMIMAAGTRFPHCIAVNGEEFNQTPGNKFTDAYALSWTTFSTVGYGLIFPATSNVVDNVHKDCTGITILTSVEAFIGILFASMMGAIMFGKIARIRSNAQVTFSDPIVVRYGSGVVQQDDEEEDEVRSSDDDDEENSYNARHSNLSKKEIPCPELEFRVVNRLHNVIRGEIMDCQMSIVAVIDSKNADNMFMKNMAQTNQRRRKGKKRGSKRLLKSSQRENASNVNNDGTDNDTDDNSNSSPSIYNKGRKNNNNNNNISTKLSPLLIPPLTSPSTKTASSYRRGSKRHSVANTATDNEEAPLSPSKMPIPEDKTVQMGSSRNLFRRTSSSMKSVDASSEFSIASSSDSYLPTFNPRRSTGKNSNNNRGHRRHHGGSSAKEKRNSRLDQRRDFQAFEEDHTGRFASTRIFSKLEIDSPDHPFFKRVWTARHTINENSPLLTMAARERVRNNNGFWPSDMNNHRSVRDAICFDQIIISFSGTSNNDASSVYSQKVYDYDDVNIGYRFVSMLYREKQINGGLGVDMTLLNDVVEQVGGGGEPFCEIERIENMVVRSKHPRDIAML